MSLQLHWIILIILVTNSNMKISCNITQNSNLTAKECFTTYAHKQCTSLDCRNWYPVYIFGHTPESVNVTLRCNHMSDSIEVLSATYRLPILQKQYCPDLELGYDCISSTQSCTCCSKPLRTCSRPAPSILLTACTNQKGICHIIVHKHIFTISECANSATHIEYSCEYKGHEWCVSRWIEIVYRCVPDSTIVSTTATATTRPSTTVNTATSPTTVTQSTTANRTGQFLPAAASAENHSAVDIGVIGGVSVAVIVILVVVVLIVILVFRKKTKPNEQPFHQPATFVNNNVYTEEPHVTIATSNAPSTHSNQPTSSTNTGTDHHSNLQSNQNGFSNNAYDADPPEMTSWRNIVASPNDEYSQGDNTSKKKQVYYNVGADNDEATNRPLGETVDMIENAYYESDKGLVRAHNGSNRLGEDDYESLHGPVRAYNDINRIKEADFQSHQGLVSKEV